MPHNGEQRDTNDNRTGFNSVNLTLLSDTTQKSQGMISPSQLQLSIEDVDANCHGIDSSSYKSIYDRMKNAMEISSGRIDFFKRVIAMFYNSYACCFISCHSCVWILEYRQLPPGAIDSSVSYWFWCGMVLQITFVLVQSFIKERQQFD